MLFNATNRAAGRFLAVCTALSMLLSFVPVFPQVANAATSSEISAVVSHSTEPEYFEISYTGDVSLNLDGWEVQDFAAHTYAFSGVTLTSGNTYRVCQDAGTTTACDALWNGSNIWNDDGDTFTLRDSNGVTILEFSYTDGDAVGSTGELTVLSSGSDKIDLCHKTESEANPYNKLNVNLSSFFNGGHDEDSEDIIPPFYYEGETGLVFFAGNNWTDENETFLEEGCGDEEIEGGEGEGPEKTTETIIVTGDTAAGENQPGWLFNRDGSTASPFEFNSDQQSIGVGSLNVLPIGANPSDKFIGENFLLTPIADIDQITYDFMIGSGGDNSDANEFYMNVYANFGESDPNKFYDCRYNVVPTTGSTGSFTTVTFDPTQSYPVTTRTGDFASPHTCPSVPADMDSLSTGSSTIRVMALNVGDTSANDEGVDGYLDNVVVETTTKITTYDFEPAPTATVTICKVNEAEDVLDGWTLHLLGDLVETVEVPSDGSIVSSSNSLTGPYAFVATGTTYQYRGDETSISDATFSRRLASGDPISAVGQPYDPWIHMNELPGGYNGMLGITVDSATTEWGDVFNPLHEYALQYEGDGDQATFQIRDSHYHDNTGSLFVDIFEGYTGVTGENGCVTFDDVPYGTYEADEIMQDGWRNLSGLGTVVIDEETEEFTIQNTDQAPEMCSVTIVSDETNTVEEKEGAFAQFLTTIHKNWTALIDGADWIWGDDPVEEPTTVNETQTFVKTFEWNGPVASAELEIAADNWYEVKLNGVVVATSTADNNFQTATQDTFSISGVQTGDNTLEIAVTNKGTAGSNATSNPAGLLYKLTVVGTEEGEECTVAPKVASLEITNPATDGETLEGIYTFEAEYIDDDETVDTILWAIR